jgi:hypothetical protein
MEQASARTLDEKVQRITMIKTNEKGSLVAVPVYDELTTVIARPVKKQTGIYKVAGKKARKGAVRGIRMFEIYLALHERSNRKKKNGWARDFMRNSVKAMRKSRGDK